MGPKTGSAMGRWPASSCFAKAEGGITAFLVEPETAGVKVGYREKTLGLRVPTNTIYFDNVHVPETSRLGVEGKGMEIALQALSLSRLALAAIALGATERCLEESCQLFHRAHPVRRAYRPKTDHQNYIADAKTQSRRCAPSYSTPLGWPTRSKSFLRKHRSPSYSALASPTK